MQTITIELSTRSCQRAVKELERYQKSIKPKLEKVCKLLVEIGVEEAQRFFDMADNGNRGTRVTSEKIENGYSVLASGEKVYFVEFGTGDAVTGTHGFDVSIPVESGSYSETHAQKYSVYGYWWYGGEKLTETPIYAPMFHAERKMRQEVHRIVKEVFG